MRRLGLGAALALAVLAGPATAVQPDEVLTDPALEARARAISAGLRCLVCQNQSIDDSNAPLARDLRLLVRERLEAGLSDAEVEAFIVTRYGDFVLLRPPLRAGTILLWAMPLIALSIALWAALSLFRRGAPEAAAAGAALSRVEEARLSELLGPGETTAPGTIRDV
jgi:cytochrome c-type biogenesis protein CcmH